MKSFLLVIVMLVFSSCYQIERDCANFKTGKFQFNYTIDGIDKTGTFVRTDDYSIDYYENKIDSSSIRWINDCEFILKKINPKSMADKDAVHMKILTTTKDAYTFEYKLAVKDPNKKLVVKKGIAKRID